MHNTAEPESCTGAAPPPGARRFTVSYHSARPGAGVRAWSVTITSPPSRRWCTSWGPPRDRAGWPRAARRASWRAARRQAAAPPRAPVGRGGRRGEHLHAAAPPPAAAPPRRRAHTSLHSSSVLERMRTTSPSDRSVCWHATCGERWRRGEHLHAAPIRVLARHLEARAARPMERGTHERRVERRAHVLVRRRLEHSRLDLKRHKAPSVVISRHQWPISGDQRRSAAISGQLAAIEGHQRSSAVIRGHQEGHQRSSEVIRRPSSVIIGQLAVTNGPSTAIAPVRSRVGARGPEVTHGRPRAPAAAWAPS